ncbi:hypothetical protein ABZP36_003371 [Zizania latifolia]
MWESLALTLASATGNNIGKVLQKKSTHILPPLSFKLKVHRPWPPPIFSPCLQIVTLPFDSMTPFSVFIVVSGHAEARWWAETATATEMSKGNEAAVAMKGD